MLNKSKLIRFLIPVALGLAIWAFEPPEGVTQEAWLLFSIFVFTIGLVISEGIAMGAATLMGLTIAVLTKALTFQAAFAGYANEIVWLILSAFFIAQALIQTGLGKRIAYIFVRFVGRRTIGLGYGMAFTEVLLAPAIPSMTARTGAIVYPVAQSLAGAFGSRVEDNTSKRLGTYLTLVVFHASVVSSAMFLTAMAANPLVAKLAGEAGLHVTWANWALLALLPGLCALIVVPLAIYWLSPPEVKETPHAVTLAKDELRALGPMKRDEKITLVTFLGLLILWIFGDNFGVSSATAALLGMVVLVLFGVLRWSDLLKQSAAWETFVWFGAFIAMAEGLSRYGLTTWFGEYAASYFVSWHWVVGALGILLVYFYTHYFFASSTSHVGAIYLPFILVAIKLGAPALLTAVVFGHMSNLFMGLTHYGCGPAPILYGSGFVSLKEWWKIGFIMSVVNIFIWLCVGTLWWSWLGYLA